MKTKIQFFLLIISMFLMGICFRSEVSAHEHNYMHSPVLEKDGWSLENGRWIYYSNDSASVGWKLISGIWYYFTQDGIMQTDWQRINGTWYYFAKSGAMQTGWQKIDTYWYYLDNSGAMAANSWKHVDGYWYLFGGDGTMLTGWQKADGYWYLLSPSGYMLTGWQKSGNTWYFLDTSGAMISNTWRKIGAYWYFFNASGAMQTGWQKIGSYWYYFSESGEMQTGLQKIGEKWYYLDPQNGNLLTGKQKTPAGEYEFTESGVILNITVEEELEISFYQYGTSSDDTKNGEFSLSPEVNVYSNNPILSIVSSDSNVIKVKDTKTLVPRDVGEATITVTDIAGNQKDIHLSVRFRKYTTDIGKASYDDSMIIPAFDNIYINEDHIYIYSYADFDSSINSGYQLLISANKEFDENLKSMIEEQLFLKSIYETYDYVRFSVYGFSNTAYAKLRSYRIEGDVVIFGPWSEVETIELSDYENQRSQPAEYTYNLFFMDGGAKETYSGESRALFVQTDNPDPNTISIRCYDSEDDDIITSSSFIEDYNDINYIENGINPVYQVDGGYIYLLWSYDAGTFPLEIRELHKDGYSTAINTAITLLDYDSAEMEYIDALIREHTTNDMNPLEKLRSIVDYLKNSDFKYLTMYEGSVVGLAAEPNGPWFISHRWDSYISPAVLKKIADRIGGFEETHNCYYDYKMGSSEWQGIHYFIYVTYEGEQYYFQACPSISTGDIGSLQMIDFSDTSTFTKIN